jgi:hypothetical protein
LSAMPFYVGVEMSGCLRMASPGHDRGRIGVPRDSKRAARVFLPSPSENSGKEAAMSTISPTSRKMA